MNSRQLTALLLLGLAVLTLSSPASACSVCFGESDHPIVQGVQASILFLGLVIYSLLAGGVAMFFVLRRRARRLANLDSTPALD